MNRWYAIFAPQHNMLPAEAACGNGTTRRVSEDQISKPAHGRRT